MHINEKECEAAGIDPKELKRIAKGMSKYGKELKSMGLYIFGSDSDGNIYHGGDKPLVLGSVDGQYTGGHGAVGPDENGLLRGE